MAHLRGGTHHAPGSARHGRSAAYRQRRLRRGGRVKRQEYRRLRSIALRSTMAGVLCRRRFIIINSSALF